jgi:hypothetical protein
MASYRTVIKKASGQVVAPTPKQTSLREAKDTLSQRAHAKPHLTFVLQMFVDGAWENYE